MSQRIGEIQRMASATSAKDARRAERLVELRREVDRFDQVLATPDKEDVYGTPVHGTATRQDFVRLMSRATGKLDALSSWLEERLR